MSDDTPRPGCPVCGRPMDISVIGTSLVRNVEFWADQVMLLPGDAVLSPDEVQLDGICECGFRPIDWEIG